MSWLLAYKYNTYNTDDDTHRAKDSDKRSLLQLFSTLLQR